MDASNLFLDQDFAPSFQKTAATKLSDNPDKWQSEIASVVYREVPYLGDYAVNVVLDRVDAQRGAALGRLEVSPQSEAATKDEIQSLPRTIIPVVVTNRSMQPLDIFMDGKGVFPLTERRLREHLMMPNPYETSTRKPLDQGIVDQLYPPLRTNYGYGNSVSTGTGMGGFGKFAEEGRPPTLLEAIAPTINPEDADSFVGEISGDKELKILASRNPEFQKLAMGIASSPSVGIEKTAEAMVNSIRPTVVQMRKLASGNFRVRWANREVFLVKEAEVSPEQASSMMGSDKVVDVKPDSTITMSTDKAKKTTLTNEKVEQVRDFGQYRVQATPSNRPMVGWVLPILDFEMHPLPLFLFTDGSSYSVQDDIAGSRVGHDLGLPQAEPSGNGAFYYIDNSRATAFLPVTIKHTITMPDGAIAYAAETAFGENVELHVSPGIAAPAYMDEGRYAIPANLLWMPLGEAVNLVKDPTQVMSVQEAQQMGGSVDMVPTAQDEVSLEGQPVEKVALDQRQFIDHAQAEFLLVAAGANPFEVREKLAHANKYGRTKIAGLLPITPLRDVHDHMVKKASELLQNFPYELKKRLVKEAAAMADSETADSILSLGFLNPENLSTFVNYIPQLEDTASKLAELLLAARLGQSQIPEGAVERSMKQLDQTIEGLRALSQKEMM